MRGVRGGGGGGEGGGKGGGRRGVRGGYGTLMPLLHAPIASERVRSFCPRTRESETIHPATEPHMSAMTESAYRSAFTSVSAGRPSSGSASIASNP